MYSSSKRSVRLAVACWLLGRCTFDTTPLTDCSADQVCASTDPCYSASKCVLRPPAVDASAMPAEAGRPSAQAGETPLGFAADSGEASACVGTGCGVCKAGSEACAAECSDLSSDPQHCGKCGQACAAPIGGEARCDNGTCASTCPADFIECDGRCVDANSQDTCGGCQGCGAGERCLAGRCVEACPPDKTFCDGSCSELALDVHHCGSCNSACPTGEQVSATCEAGVCQFACTSGYTLCDGECVPDALILDGFLGTFGPLSRCEALAAARQLAGVIACTSGQTLCQGVCADLLNDSAHCGTCGSSCVAPAQCREARCKSD